MTNLSEAQATQAADLLVARMPEKVKANARANVLKDWAEGRAFTLEAVYFGRGNWAGRGVAG